MIYLEVMLLPKFTMLVIYSCFGMQNSILISFSALFYTSIPSTEFPSFCDSRKVTNTSRDSVVVGNAVAQSHARELNG